MKRLCLSLLLCLLAALLLSGCGERREQEVFDRLRTDLEERETLSFQARLRCVYPDREMDFRLAYEEQGQEKKVTVLEPERIAGISACSIGNGLQLDYDGLILDAGEMDDYGLSPMSALPLLTETLRQGYPDSFWTEGEETVLGLVWDEHLSARVWLNKEEVPVRAELFSDAVVTAICEISDWR